MGVDRRGKESAELKVLSAESQANSGRAAEAECLSTQHSALSTSSPHSALSTPHSAAIGPFIHFFGAAVPADAPLADVQILGGKGLSLARMSKFGLPVPPGFTISAECCRIYHEHNRWPDGLEAQLNLALAWLERSTGATFGAPPRPLLVAVRSGAAVSMPGMMDTVLNVGLRPDLEPFVRDFWTVYRDFIRHYGETVSGLSAKLFEESTHENESPQQQAQRFIELYRKETGRAFPSDPAVMLHEAVNAVFASWNSERAVHYRARNNVRNLAGTAVNIMSMFPSQMAGVLFTQDPQSPERNCILIEAARGLGEALVQGDVEPDVFVVERANMGIAEKRLVKDEPLQLSDAQVNELAQLGLRIEEFFGYPVDIEWGWADGRFALLQSRRIRGLDVAQDVPKARQAEIDRLKAQANGSRKVWAVHNAGETLAFPTPLTWDIIGGFLNGDGLVGLYAELGFTQSARVKATGFLDLIAGRVYADVERAAELFFGDFPFEYDLSSGSAAQLLGPPSVFNYERAGASFLLKLPLHLLRLLRSNRVLKRVAKSSLEEFENTKLPAFLSYAQRARAKDLSKLSLSELLNELKERERIGLYDFGRETLKPGFLAAYYHGRLMKNLEQIFGEQKAMALAAKLLSGLDGDKTVESNAALYRVSAGQVSLDTYLAEYGHRAVNELELGEKRWREDSGYLQQIIGQYRTSTDGMSPVSLHERQKKERLETEQSLPKLLAEQGASSLEDDVRAELLQAQRYLPFRETGKHYFILAISLLRDVLQELAQRYDWGPDLYFLRRSELPEIESRAEALRKEIAPRRVRWQSLQRLPVPEVLTSDALEKLGRDEPAPASASSGVFTGLGVAAGVGTGTARVVKSPAEAGELGVGYVLVCPTTDPSWTPLFVHAKGLVVERGGMLSHGAIVARDFGIPAVVLKDASRLIPNGATVKVDGSTGRVEICQ